MSDCNFTNHNDSGLKIQMNEGGEMKNMVFSNLVMKNVPRPVFLTFCQKNAWVDSGRELPPMKRVRDIQFKNIAVDSDTGGTGCGTAPAFGFYARHVKGMTLTVMKS